VVLPFTSTGAVSALELSHYMKIGMAFKLVLVASGIFMNSEALAGIIEYEFTGAVNIV